MVNSGKPPTHRDALPTNPKPVGMSATPQFFCLQCRRLIKHNDVLILDTATLHVPDLYYLNLIIIIVAQRNDLVVSLTLDADFLLRLDLDRSYVSLLL
jgi:hypothetical protein